MNKLFVKTFCSFYCFCQVHIRFISWCNCDCTGFLVWFYKSCLSLRPIVNKITSVIFKSDEQEAVSSKLRKELGFFVWNLGFQGQRMFQKFWVLLQDYCNSVKSTFSYQLATTWTNWINGVRRRGSTPQRLFIFSSRSHNCREVVS